MPTDEQISASTPNVKPNPQLRGELIFPLSPEAFVERAETLIQPVPQDENWERFWCGRVDEKEMTLMYHTGALDWNQSKIRSQLKGKISATEDGMTRLKYRLAPSRQFLQFSLVWLGLLLALLILAFFLDEHMTWVDSSIRNLWVYLPMFCLPGAIIYTWQYFWKTRYEPIEWLKENSKS